MKFEVTAIVVVVIIRNNKVTAVWGVCVSNIDILLQKIHHFVYIYGENE